MLCIKAVNGQDDSSEDHVDACGEEEWCDQYEDCLDDVWAQAEVRVGFGGGPDAAGVADGFHDEADQEGDQVVG